MIDYKSWGQKYTQKISYQVGLMIIKRESHNGISNQSPKDAQVTSHKSMNKKQY